MRCTGHLVITGGGGGIGGATARQAGREGWAVTLGYRASAGAAFQAVADIEAGGGRALARPADVTDPDEIAALFEAGGRRHGPVTGVVVNAGRIAAPLPLAEIPPERIRAMVEVNLTGGLLTAREAARRLSTARGGAGGAIVIVSSIAARTGSPGEFVDYAACKGGLDSLTAGLAAELAREGVRVNAVRPGLIETPIHGRAGMPDRARRLGAGVPLGRAGRAEEVAEAILWLLSEKAAYVTGALLDIAGGR